MTHETWRRIRLEKDLRLRTFQQLHQPIDEAWWRASGDAVCLLCGLTYRDHPIDPQNNIDHRLCNGEVVHL